MKTPLYVPKADVILELEVMDEKRAARDFYHLFNAYERLEEHPLVFDHCPALKAQAADFYSTYTLEMLEGKAHLTLHCETTLTLTELERICKQIRKAVAGASNYWKL